MKILRNIVLSIFFVITSCTIDKTDYEAELYAGASEYTVYKEATAFTVGNYKVSLEALNGVLYKGYNEIHVKITNNSTNSVVNASSVTFLPIFTKTDGSTESCPHQYTLDYQSTDKYFKGYSVFTGESGSNGTWKIYLNFTVDNQTISTIQNISVAEQKNWNLNMTSFTGNDGEKYFIALVAPQKPKVAENDLVAGIYKYNPPTVPAGNFPDESQFSFSKVQNYQLKLDPRMPEPSMGNHSSPNNQDLIQQNDGLYHGVVNYTMTGNWTLNFILLNASGNVIKGTEVPLDFTPGVQGAKSELYIDTLF